MAAADGMANADTQGAASPGDPELVVRARALAQPGAPLEERPAVLSTAQAVEALATTEGGSVRAATLHALAGGVLERVYRRFGRPQDGEEAALVFRHAARDLRQPTACESAIRGALLAGEVGRDPATSYAELYRVKRRVAAAGEADGSALLGCAGRVDRALGRVGAFRPAASVLEAIDRGLEGEGVPAVAASSSARDSDAPRIVRIEPIAGAEAARVVIFLSKSAPFRPGDVAVPGMGPPHTFVDLDGVAIDGPSQDYAMKGIVTGLHVAKASTGARITLDLDGQAYRKVFHLPEPYRVVIDVARHPPGAVASTGRRRVDRIAIDPGHGGSDPGASGPAGLREKDVTLAVARRVASVLTEAGLKVLLTRDDDRFVPLEERTARANEFGADLFISIHCNAADNHVRHGVETYVLDTTKDEIASRVAARENATSQAATRELASILASLKMADLANSSTRLAELLQRSAMVSLRDGYRDVHDGGVHTAGFYVLVGARMPSILFETSYISNPAEETRLGSDDYKQKLADAVVNAVKAYREGR
jgi:N-acetylmuramoyl-L-alanine amidase